MHRLRAAPRPGRDSEYASRDAIRKTQRLQHPRFGAVSADADRRAARRQTRARLSGSARSAGAGRRDALPADAARLPACAPRLPRQARREPRSCRASSPSATSTRTRFAFADAATGELAAAALDLPLAIEPLERRLILAQLILNWANTPGVRGAEGSPLIANTPSAALGARRRPCPPDRRHDDAAGRLEEARRPGAGPSIRRLLADHARFPEDRARALAGAAQRARPRSTPPSAATD